MMPKSAAPFFLLALLLLSFLCQAARPEPADPSNEEHEVAGEAGFDETMGGDCGGVADQEECLMRRTLAAHTDYIYTQNKNP